MACSPDSLDNSGSPPGVQEKGPSVYSESLVSQLLDNHSVFANCYIDNSDLH